METKQREIIGCYDLTIQLDNEQKVTMNAMQNKLPTTLLVGMLHKALSDATKTLDRELQGVSIDNLDDKTSAG